MNITWFAQFLAALGALNWGSVQFFNYDMVDTFMMSLKVRAYRGYVYGLISCAGFYSLMVLFLP